MKQRIIIIATLLTFVFASSTALAVNFDYSAFDKVGISHDYDDMTDSHVIKSAQGVADLMDGCLGVIQPAAVGQNVDKKPTLILFLQAYAIDRNDNMGLESYIVKADDTRFEGVLVNLDSTSSASLYVDQGQILCGETALMMIDKMLSAKEVKVRLVGSRNDLDFTMPQVQLDALKIMYDAYIASGAMRQDFEFINSVESCKLMN